MATCRHKSNGLMGAVRENNLHLVQYFLHELLECKKLVDILKHETSFGETLLTFASHLGRTEVVQILLKAITSIVQNQHDVLTVSDFVNHETCRGKTAIIEAVKNDQLGVVSVLLSQQANAKLPSRIHHKSALDWAITLGYESIASAINKHVELEEHVSSLFKAVSKFDITSVKELTEGGVPHERNQDARFQQELESKKHQVEIDRHNQDEISLALDETQCSKTRVLTEIQDRELRIASLFKKREELIINRRNEVMTAITKVRLAIATENISDLCNLSNPPVEFELISKALCTLLHVKVKITDQITDENMPHWVEMKVLLQDKTRFYHRIVSGTFLLFFPCPCDVQQQT